MEAHLSYFFLQFIFLTNVEESLNCRRFFERSDHIGRCPVPQKETYGPYDNRLPGPRLSGNHIETIGKRDLHFINDGKISDAKFR